MAKRWTEEDEEFLKEWYPTEGAKACAEILDRTVSAIKHKAEKLGIRSNNSKLKTDKQYKLEIPKEYTNLEDYKGSGTKITHKHLVCGHEWLARPADILSGYRRCPLCGGTKKLTNIEYINRLQGTEYEALELYINTNTKILHKHTTCGSEWLVRPKQILRGEGCPVCCNFNSNIIYFIYFPELDLYKIGITNNLKIRLKSITNKELIILSTKETSKAYNMEQDILSVFSSFKKNTGQLYSGNTETFKFSTIEVNSIIEMLK